MRNPHVTEVGAHGQPDCGAHHIVLDFGSMPFPVLEDQSNRILRPSVDVHCRAQHPRQFSIVSPRNGGRPACNNLRSRT